MSEVYRAEDTRRRRDLAVKVLPREQDWSRDRIPGLDGVFVPIIGTDRDGRRLGLVQPVPQPPTQLEVVFDWFREVETLTAPER